MIQIISGIQTQVYICYITFWAVLMLFFVCKGARDIL
jgi:cytosine/uracil/thiamine/allantoin permease